jgi:hypothetical protein
VSGGVLQDAWAENTCFGCGPANPDGMHLRSTFSEDGEALVATFEPTERYSSGAPNVMYGGTVASLIDCHSVWTAGAFAARRENREVRPEFVTGELSVRFLKPTPLDRPLHLRAWVEGDLGHRTRVHCTVSADDEVTATGEVVTVRVADHYL